MTTESIDQIKRNYNKQQLSQELFKLRALIGKLNYWNFVKNTMMVNYVFFRR